MKTTKLLIIGIDGVGLDLVKQIADKGKLPILSNLVAEGISSPLQSTIPPTTFPAWTSFMTGCQPSNHGIGDFTFRNGYSVSFVGGRHRMRPTVWEHLQDQGLTASSAWFPTTYPPQPLNGYQISGWDSPVTSRGDRSFVFPRNLFDELTSQFGPQHLDFDTVDEFRADDGWYEATAKALPVRVKRRAEIARWLIETHPCDVSAFYFGEVDTAAHHYWAFHDPNSPRRPNNISTLLETAIENVMIAIDEALGELIEAVGPQAQVIIASDHGSCGSSDICIYLNRLLETKGLLSFKKNANLPLSPSALRGVLPGLIPASWRRSIFRAAGGIAPALIESNIRFGSIDFENTMAFSEELNYAPSIHFNQKGREPKGRLRFSERAKLTAKIERALSELTAPDGSALVDKVIERHEIHTGQAARLFPDLYIQLNKINGYLPVCLSSQGKMGDPVGILPTTEHLGRKGRSLPGCHQPEGLLVAKGKNLPAGKRIETNIWNVAPLMCAVLDLPQAPWFDGRPPLSDEIIEPVQERRDKCATNSNKTNAQNPRSFTMSQQRVLAERLKRLGYWED